MNQYERKHGYDEEIVTCELSTPLWLKQELISKATGRVQWAVTMEMHNGRWLARTWAFKKLRGKLVIGEAIRQLEHSGCKSVSGNIYCTYFAGYQYLFEPKRSSYYGTLEKDDGWYPGNERARFTMCKYHLNTANDIIRQDDSLKYMYYDGSTDLLDYINKYRDNPQIEYLGKMGLGKLIETPRLLYMCKDKKFRQFLYDNREEIKKLYYNYYSVISMAYKYEISIKMAERFNVKSLARLKKYFEIKRNTLGKIIKYLRDQGESIDYYLDYLEAVKKLSLDIKDTKVLYPHDLRHHHDIAFKMVKAEENKALNSQLKKVKEKHKNWEVTKNGFEIYIPSSVQEFINQGNILHQCVGKAGYAEKMANGGNLIVFIKNGDASIETVEYDQKKKAIIQCRGDHNLPSKYHDKIIELLEWWKTNMTSKKSLRA